MIPPCSLTTQENPRFPTPDYDFMVAFKFVQFVKYDLSTNEHTMKTYTETL